jgi:hypothetical protein
MIKIISISILLLLLLLITGCYNDTLIIPITNNITSIPHGEMFNKTLSGYTISIPLVGKYYNITSFTQSLYMTGFTKPDNTKMVTLIPGLYKITFTMSAACGLNGEYGFAVVTNFENPETTTEDCYNHFDGQNTHTIKSIDCFKLLNINDTISVVLEDHTTPAANCNLISINLNAIKIDNLPDSETRS